MTTRLPAAALLLLTVVDLLACAADPPNSAPFATIELTATTQPAVAGPTPIPTTVPTLAPTDTRIPSPSPSPVATDIPIPTAAGLLRLADNLDDPQGYCVDVAGFGANIRLDASLQAHTCKGRSDDQLFLAIGGGGILLSEYDRCLEARSAAPDSEINLAQCDADANRQRLSMDGQGRVALLSGDGSPLCLGVADGEGELAGGRNHLRRDLILYYCEESDPALITWELVTP